MLSKSILVTYSLILVNCINVIGQSIDIYGGGTINQPFDLNKDSHTETSYSLNNGYAIGIGIENIKVDWLTMRFTLEYNWYDGKVFEREFGLGGGSSFTADFEKSMISLGFYPINKYLFNRLDINIGMVFSRLVHEEFSGSAGGYQMVDSGGYESYRTDLHDRIESFSAPWAFGLQTRIAYDIYLTESLVLSPQYSFYLGIAREFLPTYNNTKLMRHYFCIGFEKRLNK